ncbi:TIGR04438 family Trp-rich protein [Ideonella paludis]|uniref:TIGR04438 family Trp-rich protein n=1 Tax=Ideonella paludis TaxID=1233411 RepID=A0ABS5E336_9BURK|nr:TIGR04438 family Trp-rich protein [Ideonella paludis]MBQ0937827.1 TIGR04438 family Trp-rich protein [Ideonella paludis]
MLMVILGLGLIVMHFAGIGAPGRWNTELFGDLWKFLLPFGLALLWWKIQDLSGLDARNAMELDARQKARRRQRTAASLGLGVARPDEPLRPRR